MLHFRFANQSDVDLYYLWANDLLVRENSFDNSTINYEDHVKWFLSKLNSRDTFLYLFFDESENAVGQVRIDKKNNEIIIGISIDQNYRSKKLSSIMLKMTAEDFLSKFSSEQIFAYIKLGNITSYKSFIKAGFSEKSITTISGVKSYKLVIKKNNII